VHVEVQRFWLRLFEELSSISPVIALRGNHDMVGNGVESAADAMQVHDNRVVVVRTYLRHGDVAFAGFGQDLTVAGLSGLRYLFCHHTFDGARYENGFYAKDGIDPASIDAQYVVSGHIHTPSTLSTNVSQINYIGAPRWLTAADANVSRSIVLIDTETNTEGHFSTNPVCSRILSYRDSPEDSLILGSLDVESKDRVVVDIHGPLAYVEERTKLLKAIGSGTIRVRTFPTTESRRAISESEGVGVSWRKYCDIYEPRYGTPKETLFGKAQEELNVG
jgi:DNA repair exonuclease SbcCD nuclease subunit